MITEVPGHVANSAYVQNHTQVVGGSNWDLSRSAVETPLTLLPEPTPLKAPGLSSCVCYAPQANMPTYAPNMVFEFGRNSVLLSASTLQKLKRLPKQIEVVAAHADKDEDQPQQLAKKRAEVVTRQLRQYGKHVLKVRSFSNEDRVFQDSTGNRRVEVYAK
ncbi:MAG: hypothetical protein Q7S87_08820 [Agitococcus sp.]|nr:hypothetical protein [Agitococcus sp.]MDO9177002.1 hypothetical protein [Agitococcus sp.]